jgi:uncharacterized protein (DUF1800 family)
MGTHTSRIYLNPLKAKILITLLVALAGLAGCGGKETPSKLSPSSVSITVDSESVRAGNVDMFHVEGAQGGQWAVVGSPSNGTIDKTGLFHAPNTVPQPNSVTITYTLDGKSVSSTVQVINPAPVVNEVSPATLTSFMSTVAISGSGFVRGAQVLVNGSAVTTTYVDTNHLQVTISTGVGSAQLAVVVSNPDPGSSVSSPIVLTANVAPVTISPSVLNGGTVTLTFDGITMSNDMGATIDGHPLSITTTSGQKSTATGFLPPWHTGAASLRLFARSTNTTLEQLSIPIAPTPVSFDAAARFLTQAGFGPRPDLVQHVQAIGFDNFISEQQKASADPYLPNQSLTEIINRSISGPSPLRMRVAWALQSFLVRAGLSAQQSNLPFESKMEIDSTGNFRDLMTDIASDASISQMLNLANNAASNDPNIHPNQNFARELLQLFTIGTIKLNDDGTAQRNTDGSPLPAYDQDTILDLSRVFTGWKYTPTGNPNYTFYGADWSAPLISNDSQHDKGEKHLFDDVTLPAGQSADQDRKMALDAIFAHPNLPPFISRLLIQRLVKSDPSPAYVDRVAGIFKDNGQGIRGDLAAVVRAILLDTEARAGDTAPSGSDGFVQDPYLFQTFVRTITGVTNTDEQPTALPASLGEPVFYSPSVFGLYSPSYEIPGTTINSPEFQILNGITMINRSQVLWAILSGQQPGLRPVPGASWLYSNFTTIPDLVDAINHLAYHGQMSQEEQDYIVSYCSQLSNDPVLQRESAVFLALNDDNYTVAQ